MPPGEYTIITPCAWARHVGRVPVGELSNQLNHYLTQVHQVRTGGINKRNTTRGNEGT
jgi:hypothetical protein